MDLNSYTNNFINRINIRIQYYKSYYVLAYEVALYEIFCIVIQCFLVKNGEIYIERLFQLICTQDSGFLSQVIGLPHISTFYDARPVSLADLTTLKSVLLANFGEIFVIKDYLVKLRNETDFTAETFYRHKYNTDIKLIKEFCQLALTENDFIRSEKVPSKSVLHSKMVAQSKNCRERIARLYLHSFVGRCYNVGNCRDDFDNMEKMVDKQIHDKESIIDNLKTRLSKFVKHNSKNSGKTSNKPHQATMVNKKQKYKQAKTVGDSIVFPEKKSDKSRNSKKPNVSKSKYNKRNFKP